MNRQKILDIITNHLVFDVEPITGYHYDIQAIADEFIKHEQDMLKEFEEWLDKKYGFATDYDKDLEDFLKEKLEDDE